MQDRNPPIRDDLFEEYLDGALPDSSREEIARRVRADRERLAEARLQARIDEALGRLFPHAHADEEHLATLAPDHPRRRSGAPAIARRAAIAAAAAALVAVVLWQAILSGRRPAPYFTRTPLAQLYGETVEGGFEPYYECREPQRFAETFAKRQNIPLRLEPMPAGARMLGLSYPGGLSRDTTAMLCVVDDEPVMVFVDRAAADTDVALAKRADEPGLNVFRTKRDGLVFYEVTPFDAPRMTPLMVVATSAPSQE